MKIDKQIDYTLIISDENNFQDFYQNFEKEFNDLEENHLIIKISSDFNILKEDILLFLKRSESLQQNGISFVVIYPDIDIDNLPESFNVVPTLQEALDVLEMENIQRDLGF